jgi:hypothetical protein
LVPCGVGAVEIGGTTELVAEPVVVNPDPRLAREARRKGWRVEAW